MNLFAVEDSPKMQTEQNGGSDISGKKKLNTNKNNSEHVEEFGICHQLFQVMDRIFHPEAVERLHLQSHNQKVAGQRTKLKRAFPPLHS